MDQILNEGYQSSLFAQMQGINQDIAYETAKSIAFNMLVDKNDVKQLHFSPTDNLWHCHALTGKNLYEAINNWYKQYIGL